MSERIKVVVTGAAGQIAYSLIPRLVDGRTFGNIDDGISKISKRSLSQLISWILNNKVLEALVTSVKWFFSMDSL